MQYPTMIAQNWNGALLNDAFRIVKPKAPDQQTGAIFEIKDTVINGVSLGHARIVSVADLRFNQVNDTVSFPVCNHPAPYLKKILHRMYKLEDQSPVQLLTLQWTERCLEAHRAILLTHWDHVVRTCPTGSAQFSTVNI